MHPRQTSRILLLATATLALLSTACGGGSATTDAPSVSGNLRSIAVTPVQGTVAIGSALQFHATGTYDVGSKDITSEVTWNSSQPLFSAISAGGLFTPSASMAFGSNMTTISASATSGAGGTVTGTTSLSVCGATLPVGPGSACGNVSVTPTSGVQPGAEITVTVTQGSGALCGGGFRVGFSSPGTVTSATGGSISGQTVTYAPLASGTAARTVTYRLSGNAQDWVTNTKCPQGQDAPNGSGIFMMNGPWVTAGTDNYTVAAAYTVGY